MRVCYVDESGSPRGEDILILCGFTVSAENHSHIEDIHDELDTDGFSEHMAIQENLKHLRDGTKIDYERKLDLSSQLYSYLDEHIDYTINAVIMEEDKLNQLDQRDVIFGMTFMLLLERFEKLLERNGEYGVMYHDGSEDSRLLTELHAHLQSAGTDFVEFDHVVGRSAPIDDEFSKGIQIVDLITAGIRAHFTGITSQYYEQIVDHVDRHPRTGQILGTGIKPFPDETIESLAFHPNDLDF